MKPVAIPCNFINDPDEENDAAEDSGIAKLASTLPDLTNSVMKKIILPRG